MSSPVCDPHITATSERLSANGTSPPSATSGSAWIGLIEERVNERRSGSPQAATIWPEASAATTPPRCTLSTAPPRRTSARTGMLTGAAGPAPRPLRRFDERGEEALLPRIVPHHALRVPLHADDKGSVAGLHALHQPVRGAGHDPQRRRGLVHGLMGGGGHP